MTAHVMLAVTNDIDNDNDNGASRAVESVTATTEERIAQLRIRFENGLDASSRDDHRTQLNLVAVIMFLASIPRKKDAADAADAILKDALSGHSSSRRRGLILQWIKAMTPLNPQLNDETKTLEGFAWSKSKSRDWRLDDARATPFMDFDPAESPNRKAKPLGTEDVMKSLAWQVARVADSECNGDVAAAILAIRESLNTSFALKVGKARQGDKHKDWYRAVFENEDNA